jgi:predicted protein tyrosine phosphatase
MARRTFTVAEIIEIVVRCHAGVSRSSNSGPLIAGVEWEARVRGVVP